MIPVSVSIIAGANRNRNQRCVGDGRQGAGTVSLRVRAVTEGRKSHRQDQGRSGADPGGARYPAQIARLAGGAGNE